MTTDQRPTSTTLEEYLTLYLDALVGVNKSSATIVSYRIDITQFIQWLHETALDITTPIQVTDLDITGEGNVTKM